MVGTLTTLGAGPPSSAIALGNLGGLPVLDLEGLWTRYEDPAPLLAEIATLEPARARNAVRRLLVDADARRTRKVVRQLRRRASAVFRKPARAEPQQHCERAGNGPVHGLGAT